MSTIAGLFLAFGSLYAMIILEDGKVSALLLPGPIVLVFGATIAVGLAGTTGRDVLQAFKTIPRAVRGKTESPRESIKLIVSLAEKARGEGLLSLESEAAATKDPFVREALQSVADGTDGEALRTTMEDEIDSRTKADRASAKFFRGLGGYAPTVGIIGTVVSLTHVLDNLSEPDKLGPMIAAAFVATLWGLLSANFIWLPIGGKISRLCELETDRMTLLMEGICGVQEGTPPRLLEERLKSMVPTHQLKPERKENTIEKVETAA